MRVFWLFLTLGFAVLPTLQAQESSPIRFSGRASYYGDYFQGRRTASGERFDVRKYTAAHRTLPFGTLVKVTNLINNKAVILKINDRGPHVKSRIIDLSKASAKAIDLMRYGAARVSIEVLNGKDIVMGPVRIRTGPDLFQNTAMYLPGNTYNYWGHMKNPEGFGFQIGAYTDLISAREACQALLMKNAREVYIQVAGTTDGKIYRLMLNQFPSRKLAEEEIACLSDMGLKGFIRQY